MLRTLFPTLIVAFGPTLGWSQSKTLINDELNTALDFRSVQFAECEDQPTCKVGAVTIKAERRETETSPWLSAEIYWDPIDGLGVKDGAQNDEIDFDERLNITFDDSVTLKKIWFTDLFLKEDGRYTANRTETVSGVVQDVEIAGYELLRDGEPFLINEVEGTARMPWQSFNMRILSGLTESGDLRRRVIIREDRAVLIVPDPANKRREVELVMPIHEIDPEKLSIFEGTETVEIDISEILVEFEESPLFLQGTHNYERLKALLDNPEKLEAVRQKAQRMRTISDLSNGELGVELDRPELLNGINFYAPFNSSNDFSVAGLILQ